MDTKTVVSIYLVLFLLICIMMFVSNFLEPSVRETFLPTTEKAFETLLGALVGSLSTAYGGKKK